ncbi:MAG TPA: 3'(2'),5'-bisphosphate nucleotidase CysQ [Candidatus Binatia bacterium]|jgi:myo-inositol-1(or 4)-monophosphatase
MAAQNDFFQELETAERAAREAGAIIMGYYGKEYRIEEKSKNNPVTVADLEANVKIQEILLGRYPADGWLSEESKDDLVRLKTPRVWIIDPIDGTREFIEKIPQFTVSIGLAVEGRPAVGVVYNPAQAKLYKAAKGFGAALNDSPIRVTPRAKVEGAALIVSRSEPRKRFQPFAEICHVQPVGSIAFRLALIGGGEGDAMLTFRALHEWDVCGGVAVVEGAGGVVIDGQGNPITFNRQDSLCRGMVAANPTLAKSLHGMLAKSLAENF